MKKLNFNLCLLIMIFAGASCTPTKKMSVWKPAYSNIGKIKLIELRGKKSLADSSYKYLNVALRDAVFDSPNLTLLPAKSSADYNRIQRGFQRVQPDKKNRVEEKGIIIFSSKFSYRLKETAIEKEVELEFEDELNEKEYSREEILKNGIQVIVAKLEATFELRNTSGKIVLSPRVIKKFYTRAERVLPDTSVIKWMLAEKAARQYLELLSTHKEEREVEYISGGDDYAVTLIKYGAYNKALKHLHSVSNLSPNNPANTYHMGLAWELLGDFNAAWENYNQAASLNPDNVIIRKAVLRTEKSKGLLRSE